MKLCSIFGEREKFANENYCRRLNYHRLARLVTEASRRYHEDLGGAAEHRWSFDGASVELWWSC